VDFEGRHLDLTTAGGRTTLTLTGAAARVTVLWRFGHPAHATLDGRPLELQASGDSATASFSHSAESRLVWW